MYAHFDLMPNNISDGGGEDMLLASTMTDHHVTFVPSQFQ
jgi:hypothetical protein